MGHQRASDAVLGQLVSISVMGPAGPEPIGEFEKAKWKVQSEVKKRKPLGFKLSRKKLVVDGWEGELERGKIDGELVRAVMAQWAAVLAGECEVVYAIDVVTTYCDGTEEVARFRNVIFPDYEWESGGADEFVMEKIKFEAEDMEMEIDGQKVDPTV